MNTWIFQANPKRYDVLSSLSDPELLDGKLCWTVNQYREEIKKGDIALIWMSGKNSGIYAVGEIISDPTIMLESSPGEKYWMSEEDRCVKRLRVNIKITKKFLNNPLLRSELKDVLELRSLSILRFYQATNLPVSKGEWAVIVDRISENSKI